MADTIIGLLISRLHEQKGAPAIAAAAALGRFGGSLACAGLGRALLTHADSTVRCACADALGRIGGMDAARALVRVLGDRDRVVWQSAAEALMGLDDDAMAAVILLFQSRDRAERRAALSGLLWLTVEHDDSEASMSNEVNYTAWGWWN